MSSFRPMMWAPLMDGNGKDQATEANRVWHEGTKMLKVYLVVAKIGIVSTIEGEQPIFLEVRFNSVCLVVEVNVALRLTVTYECDPNHHYRLA